MFAVVPLLFSCSQLSVNALIQGEYNLPSFVLETSLSFSKRKHKNVLLIFSKCSVRRSNSNSCAYFQSLININKLFILVQLNVVCRVVREQGGRDVFFSCDNNLLGHPFSGHLRRAVLTHFLATFL